MTTLTAIEEMLRDQSPKPPLEKWQPALSGDIDIRIDGRGDWYHEGTMIQRHALVKLFASILRRESDGEYYLVTPVEKWRVRVEDAPLFAVDMEIVDVDERKIWFRLNVDDLVLLDSVHALDMRAHAGAEAQPYLQLDNGLAAKLTTSVFYRLVDAAEQRDDELGVRSAGQWFSLGKIN